MNRPLTTLALLHDEAHEHMEGDSADEEPVTDEEHGHDDEAAQDGDTHSEFHARYIYDCVDTSAITSIDFPFFDAFENALEIEAQYVTAAGSGAGSLERGEATLALD